MDHKPYIIGEAPAVDALAAVDYSKLRGKSCIVTGGASGIGEEVARILASHDAFVTIGDVDEKAGPKIASELGDNAQFVQCDVTSWDDQVKLFKTAIANSPHHSCDVVLINAGIAARADDLAAFEDQDEPRKPDLRTFDINIVGYCYSVKLAMHYFVRQPESDDRDRCLIMTASLAGYVDQPGAVAYNASKYATRSLMKTYRQTSWEKGIRVNIISPWYIRTGIISEQVGELLESKIEWANVEDAGAAVAHLASDRSINGRSLGVVPRSMAEKGYVDLMVDDCPKGSLLYNLEQMCINAARSE